MRTPLVVQRVRAGAVHAYDAMQANASGALENPDRRHASLVRDTYTGLVFVSYIALHRWRTRHGLPEASCHSIDPSTATGQRVLDADAPNPEVISA